MKRTWKRRFSTTSFFAAAAIFRAWVLKGLVTLGVMGAALSWGGPAWANITIKISVNNPSPYETRTVPIKSYLPVGIKPEQVINASGLEVGYDDKRGQSFVFKDVELAAQASAVYDIGIVDIWLIDNAVLENLEITTRGLVRQLSGTSHAGPAQALEQKIKDGIAAIRKGQEESTAEKVGPAEHIDAFERHKNMLDQLNMDVKSLKQLLEASLGKAEMPAIQAIEDAGVKKKILDFGDTGGAGSCLIQSSLANESEQINFERPATVVFRMDVTNSSSDPRSVPFKYILSDEIREKDIVDAGDLNVGYDFDRNVYYMFNDQVALSPGETRVFEVSLANKWGLNKRKVYSLKVYLESMLRVAKAQKMDDVIELGKKSLAAIDQLLKRPNFTSLTEESLRFFREDQKALAEAETAMDQLKDLMVEKGVSPDLSLVEQERACLEAQSDKDLQEALNTVITLRAQKKGTSGSVFTGKSLATVSTWKIISYIILFLGVISGVFYFVTIREQKTAMFDVLTGAFTRAYALERLKEEVKIAKGSNTKCSLLVMDMDKFKGINDTHGHSVGDMVLKEFVIAMRKGIRATDMVGRFGGDEFMVILPTSEKPTAVRIADGICRIVEGTAFKVSPQLTLKVTSSIGVATYPDDSLTADDLFNKADQSLYEVKKRGGNGAHGYEAKAEQL